MPRCHPALRLRREESATPTSALPQPKHPRREESAREASRVHGGSLHMLLLACRDGGEIREGFLLLVEATLDGKVVVAR